MKFYGVQQAEDGCTIGGRTLHVLPTRADARDGFYTSMVPRKRKEHRKRPNLLFLLSRYEQVALLITYVPAEKICRSFHSVPVCSPNHRRFALPSVTCRYVPRPGSNLLKPPSTQTQYLVTAAQQT